MSDRSPDNVVILGGTSGVGVESAARSAEQGDRVVIMGRDHRRGEAAMAPMDAICVFARTAAVEAKREGVRINVLTPSLIADTPVAVSIATDPFASKLFAKAAQNAHLGVKLDD